MDCRGSQILWCTTTLSLFMSLWHSQSLTERGVERFGEVGVTDGAGRRGWGTGRVDGG